MLKADLEFGIPLERLSLLPAPWNLPQCATPGENHASGCHRGEVRFPEPILGTWLVPPTPAFVLFWPPLSPNSFSAVSCDIVDLCFGQLLVNRAHKMGSKEKNWEWFLDYFLCCPALASTDIAGPTVASQVNDFCASRLGFCITCNPKLISLLHPSITLTCSLSLLVAPSPPCWLSTSDPGAVTRLPRRTLELWLVAFCSWCCPPSMLFPPDIEAPSPPCSPNQLFLRLRPPAKSDGTRLPSTPTLQLLRGFQKFQIFKSV